MQLVICLVDLGGLHETVVTTDPPVTYPEYLVLRYLHGDANVTEPREAGEADITSEEERKRLCQKFGDKVINEIFPGSFSRLPERGDMPTVKEFQEVANAIAAAAAETRAKQRSKTTKAAKPIDLEDGEPKRKTGKAGKPVDLSGADTQV